MLVLALFKEGEGLSNILSLDKQFLIQLGFQLLATALIALFMCKLLYQPVLKFLAARKERIAKDISDAEENREASAKTKAEIDGRLAGIEEEKAAILDEARQRANAREAQIIEAAHKEADVILNRAKTEIAREREKAADEIKRQIVEVSALVAQRYIADAIDTNTQRRLMDDVISGLEDLTWSA